MPQEVKIDVPSRTYLTPILNGEMENLANQISELKGRITSDRNRLNERLVELNGLNSQLLAMYVQQTGSFPS